MMQDRSQAIMSSAQSRVVARPVSQTQVLDPREYQLGQMRRRYHPKESEEKASEFYGNEDGTTLLSFPLKPSDPDFPFEMTFLDCRLYVPPGYPSSRARLKVANQNIPRGFAINIENGFDRLVKQQPGSTLLESVKALDKNLETFLAQEKANTIKIVPNKDTRHLSLAARPLGAQSHKVEQETPKPPRAVGTFTEAQKAEASKKRETETRQLEARMGRLPMYQKSADEIAYTIPIEPAKRSALPITLQNIKTMQLFVPILYPLQPCRIKLDGVDGVDTEGSRAVEKGFDVRALEYRNITLMSHVNYVTQNIHILARTVLRPEKTTRIESDLKGTSVVMSETAICAKAPADESHNTRPPEWTIITARDAEDSDSRAIDSYDTGDESSDASDQEGLVQGDHVSNPERGTAILFSSIELYGIELLELVVLNLTVKCGRCKEVTEIRDLKNRIERIESCRKCATKLSVTFCRELVHAHAQRAGFLDFEGCCTVVDMLPSTFIPTCSECSTTFPAPGITTVRGETTTNICRSCHHKLTFSLPVVKFLRITSSAVPPSSGPRRKKETLGLVPGTELPRRGRCRHYAKSYRWFRFSCCDKVFACDKCHNEVEEHTNEWANRMICGWCSREQNYRPQECGACKGGLVGRSGGGFWEGGKGTRDRVKMSRKDKRKFRRPGGGRKAGV